MSDVELLHSSHSEDPESTPRRRLGRELTRKEKFVSAIAATGLLTAAIGGFAVGKSQGANRAQVRSIAIEAAAQEDKAASAAQIEVSALELSINQTIVNPGSSVPATVLNGLIRQRIPAANSGNFMPSYKNAILLSTVSDQQPDAAGKFLEGAWIGVTGNDESGEVRVTAVPYDAENMQFVPNHDGPLELNVNVYASGRKGGPGFTEYEPFAFDATGNQSLHNDDGSPIIAGLGVGMK